MRNKIKEVLEIGKTKVSPSKSTRDDDRDRNRNDRNHDRNRDDDERNQNRNRYGQNRDDKERNRMRDGGRRHNRNESKYDIMNDFKNMMDQMKTLLKN